MVYCFEQNICQFKPVFHQIDETETHANKNKMQFFGNSLKTPEFGFVYVITSKDFDMFWDMICFMQYVQFLPESFVGKQILDFKLVGKVPK